MVNNTMNSALIFTGFGEYYESVELSGGAYRMAHYLRQYNWDVEVIDYIVHWKLEDLISLFDIRYQQSVLKWVGFSATWTIRHPNVKGLCDYIKLHYPEVVIIIGGHSVLGVDVGANYYVNGFGEFAGKAILEYEFGNAPKPYGKPFYNGWAINALHFYPSWPMEDYTVEYEARDFLLPTDSVTLEVSRGCRFACKFCTFPVLGVKEDTSISEELMYRYIKTMHDKWGVTSYTIADETLNDRDSKLEKLSSAVQRSGVNPNLNAFIRIDLLKSHPQQLELLAKARVWGQFYGVETFNRRAGTAVGKGLDPDTVKQLMIDTRSYMNKHVGLYRGTASFIAGLPYESTEDLDRTHKWLSENWIDQNWIMWTLTISKENDNTNLSAFGKDLSKYGYSQMTQEEINFEKSRWIDNQKRTSQSFEDAPSVYWKNAYGNYFTFNTATQKVMGDAKEKACRLGNFATWGIMSLGLSPNETLEKVLKNENDHVNHCHLRDVKINTYIQKKLAYHS